MRIAGMNHYLGPTTPQGTGSMTVLHNCSHPSVLRFEMPAEDAHLLNVREPGEIGPLASTESAPLTVDGGGIARAPVCGRTLVNALSVTRGLE